LTDVLRQQLGFSGLIVTDALVMGAITQRYGANEAAVRAVEAGADILMMPADPEGAIAAICAAVETERIALTQIQASLARIWQAKQKVQPLPSGDTTHAWEQVPPPPIQLEQLAQPQTLATVDAILHASLRFHCPQPSRLEAPASSPPCNLIVVDDALNCAFLNRQAPAITIPAQLGYRLQVVDSYRPGRYPDKQSLDEHSPTLLQLFIRGNPFRSSANLLEMATGWLRFLLHTDQLQALVVYGSPYVMKHILSEFGSQFAPDIPYVLSYGQMPAAQAVALKALWSHDPERTKVGGREFTD
jgi:beta-glucosidase